jgi:DNA-binding response OmpR family regulator
MKNHILVVDDEEDIRSLLKEFLSARGYRVSLSADAINAEKVIEADPPDLIISDLQLEDSDGLEMIKRLKTTLPSTPIMLLTGIFFDPQVVRENLSKHVSSYMQKTASLEQILEQVRQLIR